MPCKSRLSVNVKETFQATGSEVSWDNGNRITIFDGFSDFLGFEGCLDGDEKNKVLSKTYVIPESGPDEVEAHTVSLMFYLYQVGNDWIAGDKFLVIINDIVVDLGDMALPDEPQDLDGNVNGIANTNGIASVHASGNGKTSTTTFFQLHIKCLQNTFM